MLLTLLGFFMESVLLSVLSVLAALGDVRPLERRSSLVGEARPSGLAACFLRPLRSVDICSNVLKTTVNRREVRVRFSVTRMYNIKGTQSETVLINSRESCCSGREEVSVSVPSLGSVGSSCYASR